MNLVGTAPGCGDCFVMKGDRLGRLAYVGGCWGDGADCEWGGSPTRPKVVAARSGVACGIIHSCGGFYRWFSFLASAVGPLP